MSVENGDSSDTRSKKEMTQKSKYLNIAILLIILGVSAYTIIRVVNDYGIVLFTYHPTFIILGYFLLMTNGILIASDNNFLTKNLSYHQRITAHWIINLSGLILIAIAMSCMFINKENLGKSHYQTWHGIMGLITGILTFLTALGGVVAKYSFQLKNVLKPTVSKIIHSFFGMTVYLLAIFTSCLGMNTIWSEGKDEVIKPIIIILLIITTFYVLIKSFLLFATRLKDVLQR